jgi:WD40 repeat protein
MLLTRTDPKPGQVHWEARVELWDLPAKREPSILTKGAMYSQTRFSSDSRRVFLSNSGGGAWSVWEIQPAKEICPHQELLQDGDARKYLPAVLEPSPDLSKLYVLAFSGGDNYFLRFDTAAKKIETVRPVPRGPLALMILSPDGTLLAISGQDQMVHLWDAATGQELAAWRAHTASVTKLAFSPDGRILASSGSDGVIRLWDLPFIRSELAKLKLDW